MCGINIELKDLHIVLLQLSLNLVFKIIKGNVLTLFISNKLLNNSLKIKKDSSIPKGDHKIIHEIFYFKLNYIFLYYVIAMLYTNQVSLLAATC